MPNAPEFMLVSEAAKCLGVTAGTVRNWVMAGLLRAKRHPVNGYRMLLKTDIGALARDIHSIPAALKKPLPIKTLPIKTLPIKKGRS